MCVLTGRVHARARMQVGHIEDIVVDKAMRGKVRCAAFVWTARRNGVLL